MSDSGPEKLVEAEQQHAWWILLVFLFICAFVALRGGPYTAGVPTPTPPPPVAPTATTGELVGLATVKCIVVLFGALLVVAIIAPLFKGGNHG